MNARRRSVASSIVWGALALVAVPALAEPSPNLDYEAPIGCPSREDFVARVAAHGGELDRADAPHLNVAVRPDADGFSGTLRVVSAQGSSAPREVHGTTCNEVVEALSLVTALALRTSAAAATSASTAASASASSTVAPTSASTSPPPPPVPPPVSSENEEGRFRARGDIRKATIHVSAGGELRIDPVFTLTAGAGVTSGLVPPLALPTTEIGFSRANFITMPTGDQFLVGPVLRMHARFYGPGTVQNGDFSTSVAGFAIGIGPCYAPFYDTRGVVLLLCADYMAGSMQLRTRNAAGTVTQTKSSALASVAGTAELQYNLGAYLHLDLSLGIDVPFTHLTAERPDGGELFHGSVIETHALAGVGFHF